MIKKNCYILLMLLLLCLMVGCSKTKNLCEVALITDEGTVEDGSFNEGTFNGVKKYCEEKGVLYSYYKPDGVSLDNYMSSIDKAVSDGAKIIVCPGYMLEEAVYYGAEKYPKINFVLVDGTPHDSEFNDYTIAENVSCLLFAEEQAGFMAGYAAVRDGYTRLGFLGGMAEDPVIRYGYGFIQGADYAAIEMGIKVYLAYTYTGTFLEDDSVYNTASTFYDNSVEIIFACGGEMNKSVMKSAEERGKAVIGADIDQSALSPSVVFSCTKNLEDGVYNALNDYYSGAFKGGQEIKLTAADGGVAIPLENGKFNTFSDIEYTAIYREISTGKIVPYSNTDIGTTAELELVNTEIIYQ